MYETARHDQPMAIVEHEVKALRLIGRAGKRVVPRAERKVGMLTREIFGFRQQRFVFAGYFFLLLVANTVVNLVLLFIPLSLPLSERIS